MINEKAALIESLLAILWNGINPQLTQTSQNSRGRAYVKNDFHNAFINRIIGCLGELSYSEVISGRPNILPGGWFVPREGEDLLKSSCYFTVMEHPDDNIRQVYVRLQRVMPQTPLFTISPLTARFNFTTPKCEDYEFFKFNGTAEVFEQIGSEEFYRLFRARTKSKNASPDIVIDVKDKFLSKDGTLGVNEDHLPFFKIMDALLGSKSRCVVRLSASKSDSTLKGWYYTSMSDSYEKKVAGNSGMNSGAAKETKTLPLTL